VSAGTQESVSKPDCHSTSDGDTDGDTDQSPQEQLEGRGVVGSVRKCSEAVLCTSWPLEEYVLLPLDFSHLTLMMGK
jgi:hypothetical protein